MSDNSNKILKKFKIISSVYLDSDVQYTSPLIVYHKARQIDSTIRLEDVKNWLSRRPSHSLYVIPRRKHRYAATIANGIGKILQADLIDVHQLSRWNRGVKFLLCVLDIFTKRAWVFPLKTKSSSDVAAVFCKVLEDVSPRFLQTDQGKEFTGQPFQRLLKQNNIKWFNSYSDTKAACVERFNRTLRDRLKRHWEEHDTNSYLKELPRLVDKYNRTPHSATKRTPLEVTKENENDVWIALYASSTQPSTRKLRYSFKLGDRVRTVNKKGVFGKGYVQQWSDELFTVTRRYLKSHAVPAYEIQDDKGERILGFYYEAELQKVADTSDQPDENE